MCKEPDKEETMPVIEQNSSHATLINVFTVEPDRAQRIADLLSRATAEVMQHLPGFRSANIHRSTDCTRVVNYAQWDSADAFFAMQANPLPASTCRPPPRSLRRSIHTSTRSSRCTRRDMKRRQPGRGERGSSTNAATRKHSAPTNVPRLASSSSAVIPDTLTNARERRDPERHATDQVDRRRDPIP